MELAGGVSVALRDKWLREHDLWDPIVTEEARWRTYAVFSSIMFGDCAWRKPKDYFSEIKHLQLRFAASQNDIGYVKDHPFSMEVMDGPIIRQRPI